MAILLVLIILIGTAHYLRWRASPSHVDVLLATARKCGQGADDDRG